MSNAVLNKKPSSLISQLIKNEPELIPFLKEGDLVEVKFLTKTPKAVYFEVSKFGTGIIYGYELLNAKGIIKDLKPGDLIGSKIINLENDDGYIELSLLGAQKQKNWQELKDIKEKGDAFKVKVTGANKGGLVAEISEVKAFLPVSQLGPEHYPRVSDGDKNKILEELKNLIGQELNVKISDLNPRLNKLIISEREVAEENIKELLKQYKAGDIIDGVISGVADFGAFVSFADNPSIEGMIHISELDHRLIDNPKEIVKVDDLIKAKITDIKESQVFLSLKALKPNPWDAAGDKFKDGQEVKGTVYKFNPFGAYINLEHNLQGMIHVAEFGGVEEMKKKLLLGDKRDFIIESIKPEEKRIILKLKK